MPQWYDITRKPEYQSLTPEDQSTAKQEFFQRFILPKIDADEDLKGDEDVRKAAYYKFMQSPDDTGQGQITSTIGSAARGFGEIVPGAIQGAGALTGIKPLETAGEAVRSGLRYIAPVNPLYEDTILNKGANVVGNIGSVLATAGVGGAIGKGLAAERIAAGATAAEQALATTSAVTRGANAALYGSAGLQGAASGAQLADQYGLEGGARYANVLAGSLGEMGTELLPFGTIAETGAVKKLLTGAPQTGRALGAIGSEAGEEGINQLWQNAALKALAPEGTETPGLTEGVLESAAYGGLGGGILAGVNVATGAYKQPANAAAAELLHAASLASPNTKLTTAATDKQIQDSVTATVRGLGEEAAAFAENLRRTQEEGEAADVQSAQMRAQEEAAAAQEAADRQAQFEGLSQNEPTITTPVGGAIPAVGQEETATIQPEQQLPDGLGVLEDAQLAADEPTSPEGLVSESETAPRITELARQAAAINAGQESGPNLGFPQVQPTAAEQPVERRYTVANVKTGKIVSRPDEPMTHKEAVTFRSKFSQPNNFTLVDVTNEQPISPQGAAPTGIATQTGQPMSGDSGILVAPSDADRFAQIKAKPSSQRTDEEIAFANAFSKSQKLANPQAGPETRKTFLSGNSATTVGKLKKALDQQMNFRGLSSNVGNWVDSLFNEGWRMAIDARGNRQFTNGSDALGTTAIGKVGMNYADHLSSTLSPAPTQETPSSPAAKLEKEGVVPASSSETEAGGRSNTPVATKQTPDAEVSSADIESKALEILLQKRPNLSATVAAKAKKYFASRNSKDLEGISTGLKTAINHSLQEADPQELYAQLAKDKAEAARMQKMEEDDRKADEEMEKRQAKLTESRRGAYDSIVGTPTGVEMNAVSEADGQESLALVNNSGDVPGVLNAFVGTSGQFLANPENETNFPDLWKILSAGRVDEGNFAYGRAFVFTDGIGVNASDRRNAARLGVTPSVAAVRRVLIHEGLVHRGIYGLPANLQMQILQWVRQNASPQELDSLAIDYPQYADWATNPQQMLGLCEEFLAKKVEKITKFPKDGPLARLFDILKDIWRWITGETGEPTVQNLRDVVKLLKAGVVAADARLVNGGKVDIKASSGLRLKQTRAALIKATEDSSDWKDWYQRHEDTLAEFFGADADLFQKILSVTSQAASVKANVGLALKAYVQLKTGMPFDGFLPAVIKNLDRVKNDTQVGGQKISAYQQANTGADDVVVVDRHISRMLFGVDSPSPKQFKKGQQVLTEIAQKLGWQPRQVQAAMWAASIRKAGNTPESYDSYLRTLNERGTLNERIGGVVPKGAGNQKSGGVAGLGFGESGANGQLESGIEDIKASRVPSNRPSFANPINAELARAAERFRQMNERQAVETPEGLRELFNPNAQGSGTTNKLFEQQVTPQQIRSEIRAAYDRAILGTGSIQTSLQQVFDEAKKAVPSLTERQFGEQVQNLIEDNSAFAIAAGTGESINEAFQKFGVVGPMNLASNYIGVMPLEIRASRITNNIDIAIHSTRGMTGKVDKIVNGLPANSYTGKPLQDAMSQSFAPLGSQQFYDETKSLIVKSIDDMIKRGVDSGDILATVIQPDFTEEAMKGWNESAKSVAKSIFFNHGLLLAVQKQEKLLNDGDINAANKQQDKIDAWSKFWFNLTNNFGVTGNAIQRSMEDPTYQGLYLISNFKSQTKKNQQEATDANIANPNEVAKDIDEAGKKSKDGADNDVADALTGLQVDDEIAIGEAALTPENKTLWEETKNYLRTLARLTKARLKILAKNVMASNRAESADAEEARYVQMGLAGVDKLIAATQAKINKNFKKILGIPEAGKTRKPRTPKEEAAHPLIARMVARYAAKLGAGTNLDAALAALLPQGPSYRDEIINDVVSGIVGRANRSIKKPKAPGTLTDLTKQLKKILSENIKVEPQSAPEESLGRKALRAFGFVTSNEQLVQEAWDKARAKVGDILREANLVETNESIEDKLNAILGEIPQQLYSTSQARSVIKDALEGTKFDNTNEMLSDVKGAREVALKSINDAVDKEGNVDPARWQRDQSYIIHAFDGLVADLQKAKDAGIAASNKALRDAVFGADTQKALKIIIRKLTAVRPGIDAPLAPALAWKRLFEMTQTEQGELKGRMFDLIKGEPTFEGLSSADQQKLADVLEKAWDARRQQVLTNEFDRLRIKHRNRLTKKAAKVFDNRPAILKKIDSGVFDYDDLAALVGEEYGIKPLTAAENKRAKEISDRLSDDISPHERMKLQNELQEMMVNKQLSLGEMLKAWWISAVLTGPRTAFTIGWSFLSGGYELMGHAATVLLNPKMSLTEKGDALGDSIKNWWSSIGPEVRNAFMYVMTGDKTLQDPAALMQSAFFDNQFRKEMGRFSFSVAEKMITSKNRLVRYAGWFMTYGSRILNALDMFNFNITKAGSAPLVYSMLNNSYTAGSFQTSKLFKTARQKIINDEYGGTAPTDTSRLNAWARNAAYQELSKITALAENMNQVARQSNFTLEPTGFGGWLYSGLKFADAFVQKKSEAFVTRMKQDLLRNGGSSFDKILVGVAEVIQAGAMQTLPILGLQFAKFALNKLNQTISFIPVAGLIRTKETGLEGQRVHEAMIYRNQAVGTFLFFWVYVTLKAIEDEPDDEKRGWGIEGGWSNLTPQEKRQRDAAGLKENTIWWRDKNGKRTVANFINWPISPILAAAGAMSDQIKYSPEQWQEGGVMKRGVTMGWAMGKSVSETSALSQFTELFGSSIASRDPVEAFSNKAARVFGGYAGGYIPRIFKDIDRNMRPEIRKYEGWEYLGKELPYYRRYIGKEYLDIFGNVIAPSQTPWSREFVHQPDKPEYNMLSRVNSHGVWLSPAVAENRLVGKGSHKREMTDEEANRYVKIVGKGYSDLILKYGEKIISMPKDKAKKFVADKADDIRNRATKQAIQK